MNDYLRLAQGDMKSVGPLLPLFFDDEAYARLICFQVQQAIEKLLKGYLEIKGMHSKERHNILNLAKSAEALGLVLPDDFVLFAPAISEWATACRYNINFRVERVHVEKAISFYNQLLIFVEKEFAPHKSMSDLINPSADINDVSD